MEGQSRKQKVSVLITGFEPFGRYRTNPSEVIVRQYDDSKLRDIDNAQVKLTKLVLPVDYDVFQVLEKKIGERKFDLILHFGVATFSQYTRLERRAKNLVDKVEPKKHGLIIKGSKKIRPQGPRYVYSTVSMKAIAKELKAKNKKFVISNNAGSYICNLLLYQSLLKNKKMGRAALVGFVHVPSFKVFSKARSMAALDIILRSGIQQVLKRN
jgi:pyroglutamyl-peptidase